MTAAPGGREPCGRALRALTTMTRGGGAGQDDAPGVTARREPARARRDGEGTP